MASWKFLVTSLDGTVLGEANHATEKKVGLPLNRMPTAEFKLPLRDNLADPLLNSDCLIRAYRTGSDGVERLAFHGPVVSAEEVAESLKQVVSVNAAGPYWRLTKRLIGVGGDGKVLKGGWAMGSVAAPVDLGEIAHSILDDVNGRGYTGISKGDRENVTDSAVGPWHAKNAAEAIAELTTGLNSFDFEVTPTEPTDGGYGNATPQLGRLNIWSLKGEVRPDAVFEFGTSRANVVGYKRAVTRDALLTRGHILAPGWPDGTPQESIDRDADTLGARGVFEDVVPDAGVTYDNLRNLLLDEHLRIRKNPRQLVTFNPRSNSKPEWGTHWVVGDQVRARAYVGGTLRFDAMFRIWGVTFTVDENGNESSELELVMP